MLSTSVHLHQLECVLQPIGNISYKHTKVSKLEGPNTDKNLEGLKPNFKNFRGTKNIFYP